MYEIPSFTFPIYKDYRFLWRGINHLKIN
jgi:hypothetical protein